MRAIDIKGGKGYASHLFISSWIEKPKPAKSEALVKIKAFGLNRMDLLQREGHYPVPSGASKILGVEFSGHIVGLGPNVSEGFKVGDEVFGLAYGGAYAEYIAVSSHMLVHKPSHLSWEEAAGIPETWITAIQALYFVGGFTSGASVLWHAGASSVSIAGVQLALVDNASAVYVTSRSQDKIDWCVNELGATAGFMTGENRDWARQVRETTNDQGVDLVIDFMGASTFEANLEAAAADGRIVNLGFLGGTKLPADVDISSFIRKRLTYEGSSLRSRDALYQGKLRDKLESYLPLFENGSFKVFLEKTFSWEDIIEAHELMESNKTKGKIICIVN